MAQVSIHLTYGDLAYLQKKHIKTARCHPFSRWLLLQFHIHKAFLALHFATRSRGGQQKKKKNKTITFRKSLLVSSASFIAGLNFRIFICKFRIWITLPFSAMDVAIQRQLNQCTLEELIQIAIHLIFEIQYRLALLEQSESGSEISDSDDEL